MYWVRTELIPEEDSNSAPFLVAGVIIQSEKDFKGYFPQQVGQINGVTILYDRQPSFKHNENY